MTMTARIIIGCCLIIAAAAGGCSGRENEAFLKSQQVLRFGMTLREAFDAGLAEYLVLAGPKNVAGATLLSRQPVDGKCRRHVLDIAYRSGFSVQVYCNMNEPAALRVVPQRTFAGKADFLRALDAEYSSWAKNMEFRVASPPRAWFGVYDYYTFTTDRAGRISGVSAVVLAASSR